MTPYSQRTVLLPVALLLMAIASTDARANSLGNWSSASNGPKGLTIQTDKGEAVRLTAYGSHVVRVQTILNGQDFFDDRHYEMIDWETNQPTTHRFTDGQVPVFSTSGIEVRIEKNPLRMSFVNAVSGRRFLKESARGITWNGNRIDASFENDDSEHFAGLGHGYLGRVDSLDLKGKIISRNYGTEHQQQAPLIVPFFFSSQGYGIFLNSTFENRFDFGSESDLRFGFDTSGYEGRMDYFVILGPEVSDVVKRYTGLTGKPRLPPQAILGLALSDKNAPTNDGESWWKKKIATHRQRGWPLDHLVNDNVWRQKVDPTVHGRDLDAGRCTTKFEWDRAGYPDPSAYKQWLDENGLDMTLDFNRCIGSLSNGWRTEYNLPDTRGIQFADSAPDLTNPAVTQWWWNLIWGESLDPRLQFPGDALWIDEFDEAGSIPLSSRLHNGRHWAEERNYWFMRIALALGRDGWDKDFGTSKRPFTWVRGMTAGGQRYASLWSGDIEPTYDEMRLQIRGMLAAGLSGFAFWGHDAAGFQAPEDLDAFDRLYRQWGLAFGAFSPYWRPHGTQRPYTVVSRWPIDRSPEAQIEMSRYGAIRYQLMPYTYTYARQASSSGLPITRAMLLHYPKERQAWSRDQQYLWGESILVAPNATDRSNVSVWLPSGNWYSYWEDVRHAGNQILDYPSPTGKLPIFVKSGAIIPMYHASHSVKTLDKSALNVHVYRGEDGQFDLYEDDGETEAYRNGSFTITPISYSDDDGTLIVLAQRGIYQGMPTSRRYTAIFHGVENPFCMSVNDQSTPFYASPEEARANAGSFWDATRKTLSVFAKMNPISVPLRFHRSQSDSCIIPHVKRYEAESARTNGRVTKKGTKKLASGSGYIGGLESEMAYTEFSVDIPTPGPYVVRIGYSCGDDANAHRSIKVNGQDLGNYVFKSHTDWSFFTASDAIVLPLDAGTNLIRIQTDTDDAQSGTLDLDYLDLYGMDTQPMAAPAAPDDRGRFVIEAEESSASMSQGGHQWQRIAVPTRYSGVGAVQAVPNIGRKKDRGFEDSSPRLDYLLKVETPGTYHVRIRGYANGSKDDDSVHIGVNGIPDSRASRLTLEGASQWNWYDSTMDGRRAVVEFDEAGLNTLNMWMREDGVVIDQIILVPLGTAARAPEELALGGTVSTSTL